VRLPFCWDYGSYINDTNKLQIRVGKFNIYTQMWESELLDSTSKTTFIEEIDHSDPFCAKVVRVMPGAVVAITERDQRLKIGKENIAAKDIDANTALSPGDKIKVRFKDGKFEFLQLSERIFEHENLNETLDLDVEYRKAKSGGYSRSSEFRNNVLEHFDYTCCLCSRHLKFKNTSPLEAAHIIPRARRGSNSISNALCLCPEHHWAFDRGLWAVDCFGEVVLSSTYLTLENFNNEYRNLFGKKIILDTNTVTSKEAL
jgi:hypothetical protein